MDISKIRKKAKQKENGADEAPRQPLAEPVQQTGAAAPVEHGPRADEPEAPAPAATPAPAAAVPAPPPAAPAPQEEPRARVEETADENDDARDIVELLTFRVGGEEFAFRVAEVEEIIRHQRITNVPTTPAHVLGITSLRGKVIPVIDLRTRLNLNTTSYIDPFHLNSLSAEDSDEAAEAIGGNGGENDMEKILIVEGQKGMIGATIDQVLGVVRVPESELLDPPAHLTDEELKYIAGVVIMEKRFISLIRAESTMDMELR